MGTSRPLLVLLLQSPFFAHAALGKDYSATNLRRIISNRHGGLTLVLENVRKENAALIARTAECLGVGTLHLIHTPDMDFNTRSFGALSPAAKTATLSKISRSATDWVSITFHDSVASCLESLAEQRYLELVATTPPSAKPGEHNVIDLYQEVGSDWALQRCALLFGSEADGLSDELLAHATTRVTVAQRGQTQSLNVAACASIVLGEVTRRRRAAGSELRLSEAERESMERELVPPREGEGEVEQERLRVQMKAAVRHELRRNKRGQRNDATCLDGLSGSG